MENNEDLVQSFKTMIESLQSQVQALQENYDKLQEEAATGKRNWDKGQFVERNKDFFDKYRDDVKFIEGDDFDLDEVAFDGSSKSGMEEAEYIAKLGEKISSQLKDYVNRFKDKYGEAVDEVEAKAEDTDGDGEVDTTSIEAEPKEEKEEEKAEEPVEEKVDDKVEDIIEPKKEDPLEKEKEDFGKKFSSIYR